MKSNIVAVFVMFVLFISCTGLKNGSDKANNKMSFKIGEVKDDKLPILIDHLEDFYKYKVARSSITSGRGGKTIETVWISREPFGDEQIAGYATVQYRLHFSTQVKNTSAGFTDFSATLSDMQLVVEQQGQKSGESEYEKFSYTPEGKMFIESIANELKSYIMANVRY